MTKRDKNEANRKQICLKLSKTHVRIEKLGHSTRQDYMDSKAIREQLKALSSDNTKRPKMAQLRDVWADVEQALASGVSLPNVARTLRDGGLDLTDDQLKTYLYRLRRKSGKQLKAGSESKGSIQAPTSTAPEPSNSAAGSGSHNPAALDSIIHSTPDLTALAKAGKQGRNRK